MQAFALKTQKSSHRYFKDHFYHHLHQSHSNKAKQTKQPNLSSPDKVNIKLIDLSQVPADPDKLTSAKFNNLNNLHNLNKFNNLHKPFQSTQKSFSQERKTQVKITKIINCSLNRKKFSDSATGAEKVKKASEEFKDLVESAKSRMRKDLADNLARPEKEEKSFTGLLVMPAKDKYVKFKKYLVIDHSSFDKSWRTSQKTKNSEHVQSYETESSSSPNGKAGRSTPALKSRRVDCLIRN